MKRAQNQLAVDTAAWCGKLIGPLQVNEKNPQTILCQRLISL